MMSRAKIQFTEIKVKILLSKVPHRSGQGHGCILGLEQGACLRSSQRLTMISFTMAALDDEERLLLVLSQSVVGTAQGGEQ